MMMAVSFERYGRLYYLDPGDFSPAIGDKVLVPTDSGPEVAECVWAPQWVSDDIEGLPVCEGPASDDDLARDEQNRKRRAEGRLAKLRQVADGDGNLLYPIKDALRDGASIGEVCGAMRDAFGEYKGGAFF